MAICSHSLSTLLYIYEMKATQMQTRSRLLVPMIVFFTKNRIFKVIWRSF